MSRQNGRNFSMVVIDGIPVAVEERYVRELTRSGMNAKSAADTVAKMLLEARDPGSIALKVENAAKRLRFQAEKRANEQAAAKLIPQVDVDLEAARREVEELNLGYGSDESAATLRTRAKVRRAQMEAAEKAAAELESIKTETTADLKSALIAALVDKISVEDLARILLGQAPTPEVKSAPAPKSAAPVIMYHKCRDGRTMIKFDQKLPRGTKAHGVMTAKLHFQWRPDIANGCWVGNGHVTRRSIEQLLAK